MVSTKILVVSIDLGTTAFTIAHQWIEREEVFGVVRNKPKGDILTLNQYPDQVERGVTSVPTDLYYHPSGSLQHWGHTAVDAYDSKDFDPDLLIRLWKLSFHRSDEPAAKYAHEGLVRSARCLGKDPAEFLSDFLRSIYEFLFLNNDSRFKDHCETGLANSNVEIIIATPPGWTQSEHMAISEAAKQHGLSSKNIFLVSETECLFRQWVDESRIKDQELILSVGQTVAVLDAGGGTVCIVFFKRTARGMLQILPSKSLSAGSELVSEQFVKLVKDRLKGLKGLGDLDQVSRTARQLFEIWKKKMDSRNGRSKDLHVPVRGLRLKQCEGALDGQIFFTPYELRLCFEPSVRLIRSQIEDLLTRVPEEDKPKLMLLGGAYGSTNQYLRTSLSTILGKDMKFCTPEIGADSVARGGVLTRCQESFIQQRASKYSFGIVTFVPYRVVKAYEQWRTLSSAVYKIKDLGGPDDEEYCLAVTWIIRKGQVVDYQHVFEVDKDDHRFRYFSDDTEISFDDTIIIASEDPGNVPFTPLKHVRFLDNIEDAERRGVEWQILMISWSLDATLNPEDPAQGPYPRSALKRVQDDDTLEWQSRLEYRYKVCISDTETRFSLEAMFQGGYGTCISDVKQCPFERGDGKESTFMVQERMIDQGVKMRPINMGEGMLDNVGNSVEMGPDSEDEDVDFAYFVAPLSPRAKASPSSKRNRTPDPDYTPANASRSPAAIRRIRTRASTHQPSVSSESEASDSDKPNIPERRLSTPKRDPAPSTSRSSVSKNKTASPRQPPKARRGGKLPTNLARASHPPKSSGSRFPS